MSLLMDAAAIDRAVTRMAHEMLEGHADHSEIVLIGIMTRGRPLSQRMASAVESIDGHHPPLGALDITFYRDDLSIIGPSPVVHETRIDFDITDKSVVLVDDVLFTGRTVRAALDAVADWGRPKRIQLAALVDRGHRELPIRADYVGKNVPTAMDEIVQVRLMETDGVDEVVLVKVSEAQPHG